MKALLLLLLLFPMVACAQQDACTIELSPTVSAFGRCEVKKDDIGNTFVGFYQGEVLMGVFLVEEDGYLRPLYLNPELKVSPPPIKA